MPPPPPPGVPPEEPSEQQASSFVPPMTSDEISAIRSRYLGVDKKKRKIRKMSDKKFVFDWDDQDDTFNDVSSVASALAATPGLGQPAGAVMFGRGHLAGMDDGGVQEANTANRHADALERRRAAKGGGDDRHWTDKKLHEMRDRDWRIFREDFSIATRGTPWLHAYTLPNVDAPVQVVRYLCLFDLGRSLRSRRQY